MRSSWLGSSDFSRELSKNLHTLAEATAAMPEVGLGAVWVAQGAHEHEAKEHDLPLVRQGRA